MIWVIGDIHGMFDPLKAIISRIEKKEFLIRKTFEQFGANESKFSPIMKPLAPTPIKLIFIGDYIDFGPSSKEVIDFIMNLPHEKVFLLGNHEDMLLQFRDNIAMSKEMGYMWFRNGGRRTLDSFDKSMKMFGIYCEDSINDPIQNNFEAEDIDFEQKYWDFFYDLKITHSEEFLFDDKTLKFYFSHGGLYVPDKFEVFNSLPSMQTAMNGILKTNIERQLKLKTYKDYLKYLKDERIFFDNSLLWQRKEHMEKYGDFILIHGHTPTYLLPGYYENIGNFGDPSGSFENLPYFMFAQKNVMISEKDYYRNDSRFIYSCSRDKLIEINIDTGAVYGKRLTAMGLCGELLKKGIFEIVQVNLEKSHRRDEDVVDSFRIELDETYSED
jgi:serine/threonine protein phosphatase 1